MSGNDVECRADLHRDEIRYDLENMVELDFIFARAALAMEQNANEPIFNTEGKIHLRKARNPLINAKKVVPIDLSLGEDFDLLIVTGPNTGGDHSGTRPLLPFRFRRGLRRYR